jgi:hypothetical protein
MDLPFERRETNRPFEMLPTDAQPASDLLDLLAARCQAVFNATDDGEEGTAASVRNVAERLPLCDTDGL